MSGGVKRLPQLPNFLLRHVRELTVSRWIAKEQFRLGQMVAQCGDAGGGVGDRLKLGVVAAGGDEIRTFERARAEAGFEFGKARGDLREAGGGDGHVTGGTKIPAERV